eukprot:9330964-Pyramimonas_sp.AAC.1
MDVDDGNRQQAAQTTADISTIVVDISDMTLTADPKVANDTIRAEMIAEIHADEDSGSSVLDSIIDPPEHIITNRDYDPQDPDNWIRESDDHM